ncbi:hypothetical protein DOTSEDRAFT_69135 [Dothistroma septosporum NZE10]|uniref:MARVEL domain-containing protein n=1 Tax=Dothistroma septosporum (strain NZE10 / CBS 128990) TaxID=675120 RepID=N1PXW7_DOTSN|nr:hypothetical protein DOTSEDRAFT_69135 [Dothistroma septosporum NZE10]
MSPKLPIDSDHYGSERQQERIILSPLDRSLRFQCLLLWIPAFAFLLPHGIETEQLAPVLGIIPMTISLLASIAHLSGRAQTRSTNISLDVLIAASLIFILIPGWVMMAEGACWKCTNIRTVMVGTYGTAAMMLNFCFHVYFILKEVRWRTLLCCGGRWGKQECPHCHGIISRKTKKVKEVGGGASYSALPASEEGEEQGVSDWYGKDDARASTDGPRPSTDDETARLL